MAKRLHVFTIKLRKEAEGQKMEIHLLKDGTGAGAWVMILGCPMPEKHELKDRMNGLSGPSFAICAECEYQAGKDFVILNPDGEYDGATMCPELLKCKKT